MISFHCLSFRSLFSVFITFYYFTTGMHLWKKAHCMNNELRFWWLHRESNPSYRRERAVSWPLDHGALIKTGNVLLSQAASHQVSSALRSLTTVFEMGTGVTSSLLSPDFLLVKFTYHFVATRSLRYSHTLVCSVPRNSCALCYANFPTQFLCFWALAFAKSPTQSFIFCTLKTK